MVSAYYPKHWACQTSLHATPHHELGLPRKLRMWWWRFSQWLNQVPESWSYRAGLVMNHGQTCLNMWRISQEWVAAKDKMSLGDIRKCWRQYDTAHLLMCCRCWHIFLAGGSENCDTSAIYSTTRAHQQRVAIGINWWRHGIPLLVYRLILGRDVVAKPCPEDQNSTYSDGISACSGEMRMTCETSPSANRDGYNVLVWLEA